MRDPVLELVSRYQKIEADYNGWPEDDAPGLKTLQKAHTCVMNEVTKATLQATSIEGALAAIRQALAEQDGERTLTAALLEMALAFFDGKPVDNSVDNGEKSA